MPEPNPDPNHPPEPNPNPTWAPIPSALYSEETGRPFHACIECDKPLLDAANTPYMLQKCSNGRETVFEFAICTSCAENLHNTYSTDSRAAILRFLGERVDPESRMRSLLADHPSGDLDAWLESCLTCGQHVTTDIPSTTVALCAANDLLYSHAPFRICQNCELNLNERLSKKTRGEWDRFVGRNFDLPPSEVISPDSRPARPVILA